MHKWSQIRTREDGEVLENRSMLGHLYITSKDEAVVQIARPTLTLLRL